MKRGDDNELKRNLRLEKVVTSKQLRSAEETEEQDWRMMQLPNGSGWPDGEDGSYHTARVMIKGVVNVGVVLSLKPILKSWQLCLSFKLDVHRHPLLKEIKIMNYCLLLSFFFYIYLATNLYLIILLIVSF